MRLFLASVTFILFPFLWGSCICQTFSEDPKEKNLLITHPTVNNIKTILFLCSEEIFHAPGDFQIIGIYHERASYNYSQTQDYIEKNNIKNIVLYEFREDLSPEIMYQENLCTPEIKQLFNSSCGIILFGGPDIPPMCYGEETHLLTEITDPYRHYLEITFMFHLLGGYQNPNFLPLMEHRPDYAILGICLGMQTMNVATGGTLIQDIPSVIYGKQTVDEVLRMNFNQQHRNYFTNIDTDEELIWGHFHTITFEKGSFIDSVCQSSPHVWSSHHQCIGKIGMNLVPVAWSEDKKLIEAVKHKTYPNVYGVQFHPEVTAIFRTDDSLKRTPDQPVLLSYISMFPHEKGYDFHQAFWAMMSRIFFQRE